MAQLNLGQVITTPGALQLLADHTPAPELAMVLLVDRHARGDWGDVDRGVWRANDAAAESGGRVLSAYTLRCQVSGCTAGDHRLWVNTEVGHTLTTVLRPEEY